MNESQNVQEAINLYSGLGWKSFFARIRFWDAPYLGVEELIPKKGRITSLGSGEGLFENFLALSSKQREILGIEIDKERLSIADRGLSNVDFKVGDATKKNIPCSDCIILFHLLHHLDSFNDQEKVVKNCLTSLKKSGKLVIVEADIKPTFKYLVTWFTDHFLVPWLFEKRFYSPIYFRNKGDWKRLFRKLGLSCRIRPAETGKPFTHVIFECQKKKIE